MVITVYSTPTCPWCKKAKEWLKKNKYEFEDINVVEEDKARDKMIEISGQMGVPVIDVDGKVLIGFDETKLKEAIEKSKKE